MAQDKGAALILGAFVGIGLAVAGYFIADAAHSIRASDRVVEVKGLAEREVPADLALWSLAYTTTANDLGTLHKRLDTDAEAIQNFLTKRGFTADEISRAPPNITDRDSFGNDKPHDRYQAQAVVLVRSRQVDAVLKAQQQTNDLIAAGVSLNRNYEYPTKYLFTKLNKIKPEMIANATKNARDAAEQFAKDSGSKVGSIRRARQGYFSIDDRDKLSPQIKRIRVVTTVEYSLQD